MMTPARRASVGLWSGNYDETGAASVTRKLAMPMLYAAEKGIEEATAKTELIRSYRRALIRFVNAAGTRASKLEAEWTFQHWKVDHGFLPTSLDELVIHWPTQAEAEMETRHYIAAKLHSGDRVSGKFFEEGQPLPLEQPETEDEEENSSATSSSSSATGSIEDPDLGDHDLVYLHGSETSARLHLRSVAADDLIDASRTACERRLRAPCTGYGSSAALSTGRSWSPRCFRMLKPEVRARWAEP